MHPGSCFISKGWRFQCFSASRFCPALTSLFSFFKLKISTLVPSAMSVLFRPPPNTRSSMSPHTVDRVILTWTRGWSRIHCRSILHCLSNVKDVPFFTKKKYEKVNCVLSLGTKEKLVQNDHCGLEDGHGFSPHQIRFLQGGGL